MRAAAPQPLPHAHRLPPYPRRPTPFRVAHTPTSTPTRSRYPTTAQLGAVCTCVSARKAHPFGLRRGGTDQGMGRSVGGVGAVERGLEVLVVQELGPARLPLPLPAPATRPQPLTTQYCSSSRSTTLSPLSTTTSSSVLRVAARYYSQRLSTVPQDRSHSTGTVVRGRHGTMDTPY